MVTIGGDPTPVDPGPSWLCDSVTMHSDGTFLFPNMWSDTVMIKSRAATGDSWWFYTDTGIHSYKATVLSIDTMTVLDTLDSVKTIQISAYASGLPNPYDSLNTYQIKISKNHGFVQIFDFYTFPYNFPSVYTTDYFYQSVGSNPSDQIFKIIKYHSPTGLEIYDFNPGDVFEKKTSIGVSWRYPCVGPNYNALFVDSIITKTIIDPSHTRYTIHHFGYDGIDAARTYYNRIDTFIATSALVFATNIPEGCDEVLRYYYYPTDLVSCYNSPLRASTSPTIFGGFDPNPVCFKYHTYKNGFGETKKTTGFGGSIGCEESVTSIQYENLIFAVKNGDSCGTYVSPFPPIIDSMVSVFNPTQSSNYFSLFPNPANEKLTVICSSVIRSLIISNLLGQTLLTQQCNTSKADIDISGLPTGTYIIKVNNTAVQRFLKE